jgi:peroxiredoxin
MKKLLTTTLILSLLLVSNLFGQNMFLAPSANETKPLDVGAKVPNVNLSDLSGKSVAINDILANKPSIIVFYRGSWCPYCNRQLAGLGEIESKILNLGFQIIAISPDGPDGLKKMINKNHLNYGLYSDSKMAASSAFGLSFQLTDKIIKAYHGYGIELPIIPNGEGRWLPVPAVFIVDKSGLIRYKFSNPDYKVRLSNESLLVAAESASK